VLRAIGAGALLKGLPRPWQMSHPMDSIRRDAATDRLPYSVLACEDNRFKVQVRKRHIAVGGGSPGLEVCADYVGAMKTDLLRRIIFRTETQEDALAELAFSYVDRACEGDAEFARPEFPKLDSSQVIEKTDMFWPLCLPQTPIPDGQQLAGGEAPRPRPDAPE
jgi:hypothetical protein